SIVTAHHELWHDELQQWGIAVSSQTPWDVVRNLRYESTPALWHSLLYVITRFTHNPAAMQVFHLMLATAAAAVFLACAPFGRIYKTLFVLGYWPLFEYAVISRHYVLGELLFFTFLALHPWRGPRTIWSGAVLFLLAQTSFFGFLASFACTLTMLVYWRRHR